MILMRILPGVLKELVKHVPTVLFQTVEWSELAGELPKISRRMIQKEGYAELLSQQQKLVEPFNVVLTESVAPHSLKGNKLAGEKILGIYFTQLFSPHGLFLDLRSSHFESVETKLKWQASAFWTQLNEPFRLGLLKVYEGFYLEHDELYYEGLAAIGLIHENWNEADKKKLGDLFRTQFGNALNEEMGFDLEHFKDSIISLSNFMLSKKTKISKDFLYLGIYLVTLYSSLEETEEKFPVKKIYLSVKNTFASVKS